MAGGGPRSGGPLPVFSREVGVAHLLYLLSNVPGDTRLGCLFLGA